MNTEWKEIIPEVNQSVEFLEIASDFGDPLEVFREALHNAYDWGATEFSIEVKVEQIDGNDKLVLELNDNGVGMSEDTIINNFWNLGDSASKGNPNAIGEKGHGTKIYLRSERIVVHTHHEGRNYESICEGAFSKLNNREIHIPKVREVDTEFPQGTSIRIEGYNSNQRSQYKQDIIKDYLYWKTVLGTVETEFKDRTIDRIIEVKLKALDWDDEAELLPMGHKFAKERTNVDALWDDYSENAVDYYAKKYIYSRLTLPSFPEVKYDVVIYVEGDAAKREYNPMIRERKNTKSGTYKVSDRYGIWLCKDFVPIQRVNEWVTGFGTGSNSVVMLHGFVNCQKLKLTANRGSFANTDANIMKELRESIDKILNEIDNDLYKNDINTLKKWQTEAKTEEVEATHFKRRQELIRKKDFFNIEDRTILVPRNEAELYGVFISIYTLHPDLFDFEPLDYDESIGIDLLARNKTDNKIADCEFWYVELKYRLGATPFNHSFKNIRRIVCWDLHDNMKDGSRIESSVEEGTRELRISGKEDNRIYYLDSDDSDTKIKVICLKDIITQKLGIAILKQ